MKADERQTSLLAILLTEQEERGHLSPSAIAEIAHRLEVTEARVAGLLSFYPELRARPCGRHLVRVCLGESCLANRSSDVLAALCRMLGVEVGTTTADGRFTLERVYCIGNCAVSPSVMVDEDVHGHVDPLRVAELLSPYDGP